jgi:hypothetical protein
MGHGTGIHRPVLFAHGPVFVTRETQCIEVSAKDLGEDFEEWGEVGHARPRYR